MKKLTKRIISLFAGITCAVSLLFGMAMLTNPVHANADEIPAIDNTLRVQMKEGAAVRIGTTPETGDQAIRFQTYVKKSYFDTLVNPETGVYIIPKDLLTGELTNETPGAKRIVSQVYASETDTHYLYNTVLYDIPENSYGRDIIARAYVKSGSNYVWASNAQVRSLSYVASAALEDGKKANGEAFSADEIKYLKNYVDKALKSFAISDDSYAMTAGETLTVPMSVTPIYAEDDLSNLKVIYSSNNQAVATVENGEIVAKSAGIATITATLGSKTDTFTVVVKGENQDLLMTANAWGLDVTIPAGYSITSITCDGANWGTNPASLVIADALVADKTKHGEKVAIVNVSDGSKNYAIEIPVTLVTDTIATAADFSKVQVANTSSAIYGYYVLTADITGGITAGGGGRMQPTDDGVNGFRGTFDGRDHTITSNSMNGGLFCAFGRDAVVKNTTFTCNSITQNAYSSFLACYGIGATIEDVTFNFSGITGADAGKKGLIFEMGARDCAFNNVVVNITGNASTLFGGHTSKYLGFNANQHNFWDTKCTFTNTTINLMTADSSLSMLGEGWIASAAWSGEGTVTQFIADGCTTTAGATTETVEGVTLQSPRKISVTLENQDLVMTNATHSLDLGVYENYEVSSITFEGANVGKDPTAITLPSNIVSDKTKHGTGKSFKVVVTSSTEIITLTIPVTLVTDTIATAADFSKVQVANASSAIYGYYVLTADITGGITAGGGGRMQPTDDGVNGFRGTFDGRDHTITSNALGGGLFCAFGRDAVVKNTTFTCNSIAQNGWASFLACYGIGATIEDVTFNFSGITGADAGKKGLIFEMGARDCAFNNVVVNITGNASTLFGGHTSNWVGFNANQHNFWDTKCTFTNTTINLMTADSSLSMLGEGWIASAAWSGTGTVTQFIADGCTTTAGATTERVEGVTISKIETRTETLDYTQDIYLTAKLQMIDLGEYADYEIASIKLGDYDFGVNPAKLTVSNAFKADKATHGDQKLIVTVQKGADKVELSVPVIFVTDTISTMEQLLALQPTNYGVSVYGYYVLTDDIGSLDTVVKGYAMNEEAQSSNGFMGAIDGRGHTVSLTVANENNQFGLFAKLKNATIRNVTFDSADMYTRWGTALLARTIADTKFENVTFNFRNVTVTDNYNYGLLAEYGLLDSTFDNVHFIVNADKPMSLLGARVLGFERNTFTDCTVSLIGAALKQIGHTTNGTWDNTSDDTVYTTYNGITVQEVEEKEKTLSYTQDIVMADKNPALNLGAYADYEISSITYGDYDLGTDINALAIPNALREDFQNHGTGKTICVKASKYADIVLINVPATFITFEISTVNDFKAVQLSQNDVQEEIYGYYVLANDITSDSAIVASGQDSNDAAKDGTWGFRGTLDGRNHTITAPAGPHGMFGAMGSGALVKDLTFTTTSINQSEWGTSVLGRSVVGVTFKNVVFNVSNITTDNVRGLIGERTVRDCDFINVDFNVDGVVKQLFPSGISNWVGFNSEQQNYPNTLCTFTNCTINLLTSESSLGMLGAGYNGSATITYQPTGVELKDGEQIVGGITLRDNTTGTYLLRNNASPYTIVVPATMTTELVYAKDELIRFFKEATGVTLETITDTYLTHTEEGTYISLGTTKAANTAGLSVPTLKRDGAYIKTQDKTIYILGGSDAGVLNGVYELLDELFGYEQYYKDCYTLDTGLKVIELDNYNITSNPDIDYRGSGGITYTFGTKDGYVVTDDDKMYSYRLGSTDAYWKHIMPVIHAADSAKEAADHNSLYYFPISMYQTSNPEFYSNNSTFDDNSWGGINAQLCYTARGNSAGTYDLMTTLAAERIQASLIKNVNNKQYTTVQLGMEDCYQTCTCAGCNAVISQYGSVSATVIIFLNDVAVKVNNWMASNSQYARDLQYMFFAYNEFQRPPTTFPTISEGVKIVPFVALSHMDYDKAINDTTTRNTTALGTISNNTLYGWMKSWGEFAKANDSKAWAWSYGAFVHDYFVFYDSYTFYGEFFKALKEFGYEMSIVQQHSGQRGTDTAFFAMNLYLNNALAWDSSQDINTLIDNYMAAMYLDAADEMKSLFTKWKSIYASKLANLESSNSSPSSKLSKSDVDALFDILDTAYAAIAHYETSNPALYAKLKSHIDMEWLAPAKLAVTGFAWRYKLSGKYNEIASKFETLCEQFGIVALSEFAEIDKTIEGL